MMDEGGGIILPRTSMDDDIIRTINLACALIVVTIKFSSTISHRSNVISD